LRKTARTAPSHAALDHLGMSRSSPGRSDSQEPAASVCLRAPWEPETLEPSELEGIAMLRIMLHAKVHGVAVAQADLNYARSVRIDRPLPRGRS